LAGRARMAEQVKRRVNAARIAVAFAAAGVIAGAAATASGAGSELPANSVGTQQVRNDSLPWNDLKTGEVYSKDQSAQKFLKIDDANDKFLTIKDAQSQYIKQGTAILGDGSVRTGAVAVQTDGVFQKLLSADRFFDVSIADTAGDVPTVKIGRASGFTGQI